MQQIADWLEKLGMSEYAQRFAENGIDVSVLRYLTDQDLEKIGVLLGHRRKMLAAIAELVGAVQAPPQPALTESKPQDTAERRQVTVMFSDLVGSTALSARMDPEDLREVISAYQKCVAETVQRFDGSWRNTWATVSSYTSATRRRMRMMPSEQYGRDWSWLVLSVRSGQTRPCKPASALPPGWS
jgi:hypothetical protein